jgi:hypothetical protein
MQGQQTRAIEMLQTAVELGSEEPLTFATRAALQLALIYESKGDDESAARYFDLCLDLYDSDHTVDGVENKAEVGLKRVEKRTDARGVNR